MRIDIGLSPPRHRPPSGALPFIARRRVRCLPKAGAGMRSAAGVTPRFRHISLRGKNIAMSALAGHAFVKMNGLGNEIVVVDMRATPAPIAADEARAAAQPAGAPYDQMMALYPPRMSGTDAYVRIYNSDGSPIGR